MYKHAKHGALQPVTIICVKVSRQIIYTTSSAHSVNHIMFSTSSFILCSLRQLSQEYWQFCVAFSFTALFWRPLSILIASVHFLSLPLSSRKIVLKYNFVTGFSHFNHQHISIIYKQVMFTPRWILLIFCWMKKQCSTVMM